MTTLIAVYNSEGLVGRCDANCYEAKSPDCDCICGGKNHGVGRQKAIENVSQYTQAVLEAIAEQNGGWLGDEYKQGTLL